MSISTLQNKEKRLLRELESLSRRKERLSKSKQKSAFSKLLKTNKDIAKKHSELTDTQQKLAKERKKENNKIKKEQDKQLKQMKDVQQEANRIVKSGIKLYDQQSKEYDVFISYVQSDSLEYVDKLEQALKQKNIEVWRDKSDMVIGQSMTQAIENGLVKSKLAIVVLSPNYLCKYWTNFELDGIFSKQGLTGEQMILPIWNNVSAEDIAKKRPSLANLLAWNVSTDTIENISTSVANLLGIKNGGEIDA
ncbi:toll/interleukin-1 receptor domain-containing protein [Latilactobacillus curvatus]|uniref:toll/interleukin-1 receptor domain-containing protein n=1 Tax=Latilactobacillus curvatus TaxID=28038 RepID=UPI0021AE4768|nr:TIR domain-containing protein [Latilactobacillus curvatus]MCS8581809.1 TIR domain-containing protein [Latilactobacillus curvatus]MCS8605714.1 TIR domain-containing protein [Latilactobacillus curvatus]